MSSVAEIIINSVDGQEQPAGEWQEQPADEAGMDISFDVFESEVLPKANNEGEEPNQPPVV